MATVSSVLSLSLFDCYNLYGDPVKGQDPLTSEMRAARYAADPPSQYRLFFFFAIEISSFIRLSFLAQILLPPKDLSSHSLSTLFRKSFRSKQRNKKLFLIFFLILRKLQKQEVQRKFKENV